MFINFGKFEEAFQQVRILNLQGMMGTGKTLLSVAIAYRFLRQGKIKRASFNFPVAFGTAPHPRHSYAVIDEAGTVFDNRMAFKDKELNQKSAALTWRLRKLGSYIVIPSFLEVDKRFRVGVRVWRTRAITNYLWFYHWELGEEDSEERREGVNFWQGWFGLFNSPKYWGVYDTYFFPGRNLTFSFLDGLLMSLEQVVPDGVYLPGTGRRKE